MKKILLLLTIILIFCSGCSKKTSTASFSKDSGNLKDITRSQQLQSICSSEDGIYYSVDNNMLFYDYNQEKSMYLCNNIGCIHNNETCNSYAINKVEKIFLNPENSKLFYCYSNDYSKLGMKIIMSDLDGENKTILYENSDNQEIYYNIIFSEDSFYFIIDEYKENNLTKKLMQLNYLSRDVKEVYSSDKNLNIMTGYDNKIIFLNLLTDSVYHSDDIAVDYEIILFDLETKEEDVISKYTATKENQTSFSFMKDQYLFEFERIDKEDYAKVYKTDMRTNNKELAIEKTPFFGIVSQSNVKNFYDNKFLIALRKGFPSEENFRSEGFIVDTNSNEVISNNITSYNFLLSNDDSVSNYSQLFEGYKNKYGYTPATIVAQTNSNFIVITADTAQAVINLEEGMVIKNLNDYSASLEMISKIDYYNNVENYTRFR